MWRGGRWRCRPRRSHEVALQHRRCPRRARRAAAQVPLPSAPGLSGPLGSASLPRGARARQRGAARGLRDAARAPSRHPLPPQSAASPLPPLSHRQRGPSALVTLSPSRFCPRPLRAALRALPLPCARGTRCGLASALPPSRASAPRVRARGARVPPGVQGSLN